MMTSVAAARTLISVNEALGFGPEPPMPLTAEEAEEAAEAEGLTLARSDKSPTGFKGVYVRKAKLQRPYGAFATYSGHSHFLGSSVTPQEAALAIARRLAQKGMTTLAAAPAPSEPMSSEEAEAPAPSEPMTSEEAEAAAAAENLTLVRSDKSATGFKGVTNAVGSRPYSAREWCDGYTIDLGRFATAAEAALALARRCRRAEARVASGGTRGEKECPICLETLESIGGLVKTACPGGHIFHRSCLYRYFGDGCTADCPMCRHPVNKGEETPLPRPDETPPKQRRIPGFNSREMDGRAGLVLTRPKRAAPSEGGPSKRPPSATTSAVEVRQAVGELPRQSSRVCARMGLPTEHAVR